MSSGVYRVDIASTGRAGCKSTQCKKDETKIPKGELRQAVQVMINGHIAWMWRHWGCVTPTVLHNWAASSEMDMELIDGYDVLPPAAQEKVKRALEQGHVDDEDWNGDLECNRYDPNKPGKGMFVKVKTLKKADLLDDDPEGDYGTPAKKKVSKKRTRVVDDDEDDDDIQQETKPPAKKTKSRGKKAAAETANSDDEQAAPSVKKTKAPRKAKATSKSSDAEMSDEAPPPVVKKSRAKKSARKAESSDDDVKLEEDDEVNDEVGSDEDVKPKATKRKGRAKKAAVEED